MQPLLLKLDSDDSRVGHRSAIISALLQLPGQSLVFSHVDLFHVDRGFFNYVESTDVFSQIHEFFTSIF